MYCSSQDLKTFYNSKVGRVVRRILQRHIRELWPNTKGLRVVGFGYAAPYLRNFINDGAERTLSIVPAGQGVFAWPRDSGEKNCTCVCEESEIPLESNSVDRIIMVHSVEFAEHLGANLEEIWRVLKSSGRLLIVVPNRAGLWARADWSPFGQGTPYSAKQMVCFLEQNGFVHEHTDGALFIPPFRALFFWRSAGFYENIGKKYLPLAAGVHLIEVSKQLYAKADSNGGSKIRVRGRGFFPRPVTSQRIR